jgi:hypothetical protein
MKKVFSFFAALTLCAQIAHAQAAMTTVKVSPPSSNTSLNGSVGSTVTLSVELIAPIAAGSEFAAGTSNFTVNGSPSSSATNGCTVTPNNSGGLVKALIVAIPANTPQGTAISVTVSVTYTGSAAHIGNGTMYTGTAVINVSAVLAADLIAVNAKVAQGKNLLTWATASEKNNDKFVVERSANGLDFVTVGEVKAAGTSQTVNNYAFSDENVAGSINYYRLKMVDVDGKSNTSKVVAVASKGTLAVNVVRSLEGSKVNIVSDSEGEATINVYNLNGQLVANQAVNVTSGSSEHILNLNQTGLFVVSVTNGKSVV